MEELYLEHILEHSRSPHNKGEPEHYDVAEAGNNPQCGDEITLYVTFTKDGKVSDVHFSGDGCAISIAATSMLSDRVKDMDIQTVKNLTATDVYDLLGVKVGPGREQCALLALRTLKKATDKIEL